VQVAHICNPSYLGSWDRGWSGFKASLDKLFKRPAPHLQINHSKINWRCDLSNRAHALLLWSPEFKPQSQFHQKKKKIHTYLHDLFFPPRDIYSSHAVVTKYCVPRMPSLGFLSLCDYEPKILRISAEWDFKLYFICIPLCMYLFVYFCASLLGEHCVSKQHPRPWFQLLFCTVFILISFSDISAFRFC
jgi:hypothetical protein